MCAQNARFYLEATIIVHGEIILPIRCFSQFPQLFDLFFFSCLSVFTQVGPSVSTSFFAMIFSRKWDHLCRRYLTVIFSGVIFSLKCECALLYLRPSVPKTYDFTFIVEKLFCQLVVFPRAISHLFAFVYIYFYSTCPFLLACRFF